ncbi:MAG TPA: Uma2 family endonuclease [Nocardioidaceae bacterium]|nr:Uma2 family endonuclease [Nocardioidaceae bacterium]
MGIVTTLPVQRGRPFTAADLESTPDDGRRYELVDGCLIVTPAPLTRHQTVVLRLSVLLDAACPPDLTLLTAPLDVTIADDTVMQPDLLIAHRTDFDEHGLPGAPLLAIEVLSPSTRHIDLGLKKARYESAGCPSYWVVDPDTPSLTAWELRDGAYVQTAHVSGTEHFEASMPYAVTLRPADLLR